MLVLESTFCLAWYPADNDNWGKINRVCSEGMSQSPIDLPEFSEALVRRTDLADGMDYAAVTFGMSDTGHSLKASVTLSFYQG